MRKLPLLLFAITALVNLWAEFTYNEPLILISKPLLLIFLSLWFLINVWPVSMRYQRWFLLGLAFSLGGDTLLMFVENGPKNEDFFFLGLGSFLLAQLCYTICFLAYAPIKEGLIRLRPYWVLPFLLYLFSLLSMLWPNLEVQFKLPVLIYAFAIIGMAIAACNLKTILPAQVFSLLMLGVLLFILSDSLIAINKFKLSLPNARLWIMSTYVLGQYLIVQAVIGFPLRNQSL